MKKLFIIAIILVLLPAYVRAEIVWVSGCTDGTDYVSATDACSGGAERNYDTIQEAVDYASPDDTIIIRGSEGNNSDGTYPETADDDAVAESIYDNGIDGGG